MPLQVPHPLGMQANFVDQAQGSGEVLFALKCRDRIPAKKHGIFRITKLLITQNLFAQAKTRFVLKLQGRRVVVKLAGKLDALANVHLFARADDTRLSQQRVDRRITQRACVVERFQQHMRRRVFA